VLLLPTGPGQRVLRAWVAGWVLAGQRQLQPLLEWMARPPALVQELPKALAPVRVRASLAPALALAQALLQVQASVPVRVARAWEPARLHRKRNTWRPSGRAPAQGHRVHNGPDDHFTSGSVCSNPPGRSGSANSSGVSLAPSPKLTPALRHSFRHTATTVLACSWVASDAGLMSGCQISSA
jgi:hypothetical protein